MCYKTFVLRGKLLALGFLWLFSVPTLFAQNLVGGQRAKQGVWENRPIEYIEDEITVILKAGVSKNDILPVLQKYGATIKRNFDKLGWGLIEVPNTTEILSTASELKRSPLIKSAEPNMVNRVQAYPNDPYFNDGHQWALWNWGQNPPSGTSGADIKMLHAFDITWGNSDIIVAILDTGIPLVSGNLSHPDLDDPTKFILGQDFIEANQANGVKDEYGHGTHVTGIVAAEINNGVGIAGVAGNCRVLAIQVFDKWGFGSDGAFRDGVIYAVDNGARVINYSGGGSSSSTKEQAVQYAKDHNVVLVASAGNDCGGPVIYPAAYSTAYENTIAVSATNHKDVIAEYSNVGSEINVAAPGGHGTTNVCQSGYVYFDSDDIYSTTPNYSFNIQIESPEVTQNYGYYAGTSMAAPHVSGLASLMLSINSTLTPSQIRDIIQKTAIDKGSAGFDYTYGYGRINAYQALLMAHAYANKSISGDATAWNNGRRLAKSISDVYHLVFESGTDAGKKEIFYRNSFDYGVTWNAPVRLSNGLTDGNKTKPSIYEWAGYVYVVWQKYNSSSGSHDIAFHKSSDGGTTWLTSNRKVIASAVGNEWPLPVIVSPTFNHLLVVYKTATNLSYQTSYDRGSSWSPVTGVPSSGTAGYSPTLAVTTSSSGNARTALVNAATGGNGAIFYRYHCTNDPDSTGWAPLLKNLSLIIPGSYTGHKNPSLAPSGDPSSKVLHVVWEAIFSSSPVIIHRQAANWGTWPSNTYSILFYYQGMTLPSITGLASAPYETAELLFQNASQSSIFKMHYSNAYWYSVFNLGNGFNPSASVGNTTAKYVWTSGSAAPYQINTSSETLSKTSGKQLATIYHRSIAVIDTVTSHWLEVRFDKLTVKTKSGEGMTIPFAEAKEDTNSLMPANAFANLASPSITLPADAESLLVRCQVNGQGLSSVKKRDNAINVEITFAPKNSAAFKLPVINTSAEVLPETRRTVALAASNFAGKEISLRAQVTGIDNKSSLIASLGHIYEIVETPIGKTLEARAENAAPHAYTLSAFPNPFNPSTQIHFAMKEAGLAQLRVYNLNGQLVRELLNEPRAAGEYSTPWDGRDYRGVAAATGVYFIRFEAGNEVKLSKVMLVR